jgi:hypothetical protein
MKVHKDLSNKSMKSLFFKALFRKKHVLILFFAVLSFAQCANAMPPKQEIVVLIHGLMRTSASMNSLRANLEKRGYTVYSYSYPSAKNSIHEHALFLNQFIKKLLIDNPAATLYFITHSLGGIIARDALATLSTKELKQVGSLIMLAPPNQGSALAKLSMQLFPMLSYFIKPLAELSSEQGAYVHRVPIPKVKMAIIAGRYDAKVPPASTYLKGAGKPVIVNATHTFIMTNTQTQKLIIHFLQHGTFDEFQV